MSKNRLKVSLSEKEKGKVLDRLWLWRECAKEYPGVGEKEKGMYRSRSRDERHIESFINSYRLQEKKILVDLGIGPGREMVWLDRLNNIDYIIGIDYSPVFIKFLKQRAKRFRKRLVLIRDDLLTLKKYKPPPHKTILYLYLDNSLGNFLEKDRRIILRNIRNKIRRNDRLIVVLAKHPSVINAKYLSKTFYKTKIKKDQQKLLYIIGYGIISVLWNFALEVYGRFPEFWYDNREHNIVVHIGGQPIFFSHTWSKLEIQKLFHRVGFSIEKLIQGRVSYITIVKTKQ